MRDDKEVDTTTSSPTHLQTCPVKWRLAAGAEQNLSPLPSHLNLAQTYAAGLASRDSRGREGLPWPVLRTVGLEVVEVVEKEPVA